MSLGYLLVAATLAASPPSTETESPGQAAARSYQETLVARLRASESPRERAIAERFAVQDSGPALQKAAADAPGDVLVQMLWSIRTGKRSDAQAMAWALAEPGNGLAWASEFEAHAANADAATVDEAIARLAAAQTWDDHLVDAWDAYRRAIATRPMPASMVASFDQGESPPPRDPATARANAGSIMAMAYAATLPFQAISLIRACRRAQDPQGSEARFEACARIGRGIVRSESSVMTKMIGLRLVANSGLENDSDREARRAMDWRQHAAGKLLNSRTDELAGYFADLASTGSETRAQELLMARHGVAAEPPSGWHAGD